MDFILDDLANELRIDPIKSWDDMRQER